MTPRLQNADCRVQAPRGSVGGGWGVPTWPLTLETLWCQKSDADRGGNPDRRQSQDGNITSTTDNGAKVIRPAAGRKPVFSQQGGPRPRQPHKLVEGGFDSRPCSHSFGASDSPGLFVFISPGTVCAALTSSTPSVSCGGFIPGFAARVVVWFRIGVEVSLSVVVPAGPFGGVRDVTTDAPGVGPSTDAGRLLFRGPLGERPGKATREGLDMPTFPVTGGENPSTPANFHGSRPWLKRTWPKSRTNERSRKCRECRQPQPSPSNPEFPFLPSPGPEPRSTRGPSCATVIRSLFPRRPRSSSRRLRDLLGSGMGSRPASLRLRRTACRVCGVGESRVGESTGLPRREVWGALSVQDREDLSPTPRKKRGPDNRRGSGTDDRRGSRLEGVRDPLGLSEAQPVQTRGAIGWEQSSPVVRQAVKLPEGALSPTLVYGGGWGGFDETRVSLMSQSVRCLSVHVIDYENNDL